MRIYIAGSSHEISRAQAAMSAARELGHEITQDWTKSVLEHGKPDEELDHDTLVIAANECRNGVKTADLFWLLLPEGSSTGAWTELGAALELRDLVRRPELIIISGQRKRSVFWTHADLVFSDDEEALALLGSYSMLLNPTIEVGT